MRLSEAILKGCELYPYHSRYVPYDNANGTSTIGAAYAGLVNGNHEWVRNCQTDYQYREFPVLGYWVRDPIQHSFECLLDDAVWMWESPHGNFKWSREKIAKWIARRERKWVREGKKVDAFVPEGGSRGAHPNWRWRSNAVREK